MTAHGVSAQLGTSSSGMHHLRTYCIIFPTYSIMSLISCGPRAEDQEGGEEREMEAAGEGEERDVEAGGEEEERERDVEAGGEGEDGEGGEEEVEADRDGDGEDDKCNSNAEAARYQYDLSGPVIESVPASTTSGETDIAGVRDPSHQAMEYHRNSVSRQYDSRTDTEQKRNNATGKMN